MVIPHDPNATPVAPVGVDEGGGLDVFAERDADRPVNPPGATQGERPVSESSTHIEAFDDDASDLLLTFPSEQPELPHDPASHEPLAYVVRVRADVDGEEPRARSEHARDAAGRRRRGEQDAPHARSDGDDAALLRALRDLCARIELRLTRTEDAVRRTEGFLADPTLQQLSARMNVRLAETEDGVRRIEQLVGGATLQELSSSVERRFRQTDEALRRIERILEERSAGIERGVSRFPPVNHRLAAATGVVWLYTRSVLRRLMDTAPRPGALANTPRVTRRVAPVCVLILAAVVTMVRSDPAAPHGPAIAPAAVAPSVQSPVLRVPPVEESDVPAPPQEPATPQAERVQAAGSAARAESGASTQSQPSAFVGTLVITSVPAGATVRVNGRVIGVTPLTLSNRRVGSLALQISHDGFERWTAATQVQAGRVTSVNARLRPLAP